MNRTFQSSTQAQGDRAEARALSYLEAQGLALVVRNYRCKGGEIDLVMREPDGTIVFVEVRARAAPVNAGAFGGAAASVGSLKQRRIVFAAKHWLMRQAALPPCRFDVVALDGEHLQWLKAAFDAG